MRLVLRCWLTLRLSFRVSATLWGTYLDEIYFYPAEETFLSPLLDLLRTGDLDSFLKSGEFFLNLGLAPSMRVSDSLVASNALWGSLFRSCSYRCFIYCSMLIWARLDPLGGECWESMLAALGLGGMYSNFFVFEWFFYSSSMCVWSTNNKDFSSSMALRTSWASYLTS